MEFECLWREAERLNKPRSELSDLLSNKINELSLAIQNSAMWDKEQLRNFVLSLGIPKKLRDLLGLQTIIQRIPQAYSKAIFGSVLASRYVYECGLSSTPEFSFYDFVSKLQH
jgi:glutamate dehydrogenase